MIRLVMNITKIWLVRVATNQPTQQHQQYQNPHPKIAATREGLRGTEVMAENKEESLCIADRNGELDAVNSLIAAGTDVTYLDADGLTPLMHAVGNGCAEVLKALLDAGAPWNALSPSNVSVGVWRSRLNDKF